MSDLITYESNSIENELYLYNISHSSPIINSNMMINNIKTHSMRKGLIGDTVNEILSIVKNLINNGITNRVIIFRSAIDHSWYQPLSILGTIDISGYRTILTL